MRLTSLRATDPRRRTMTRTHPTRGKSRRSWRARRRRSRFRKSTGKCSSRRRIRRRRKRTGSGRSGYTSRGCNSSCCNSRKKLQGRNSSKKLQGLQQKRRRMLPHLCAPRSPVGHLPVRPPRRQWVACPRSRGSLPRLRRPPPTSRFRSHPRGHRPKELKVRARLLRGGDGLGQKRPPTHWELGAVEVLILVPPPPERELSLYPVLSFASIFASLPSDQNWTITSGGGSTSHNKFKTTYKLQQYTCI